jgi:hypothetical protein
LSAREWLSSYRGRRTYALAAWDDPGPILVALTRLLRRPLSLLRPQRQKKRSDESLLQPSSDSKIVEQKSV